MGAVRHAHAVIDFDGVSREPHDGFVLDVVDERETGHDGPILESRRQDRRVRQVVPCPSQWEDGTTCLLLISVRRIQTIGSLGRFMVVTRMGSIRR